MNKTPRFIELAGEYAYHKTGPESIELMKKQMETIGGSEMNEYNHKCPKCGGYAIFIMEFTTGGTRLRLICSNPKSTGCPT